MRAGTVLIWAGLAVAALGAALRWAPWLVSWFGNLPGDIRLDGEGTRVFIPITSMIVVSVAVSLLLALARKVGT